MENYLLYFSKKYNGNWDAIYNALKKYEKVDKVELQKIKNNINSLNPGYITILNDDYPKLFGTVPKPPFVIYYKGNIKLLSLVKKIHMTGNYENEYVGKYIETIKNLPDDCAIVNGDWKGIDKKIIEEAIRYNKKLIVIWPCGLGKNYSDIIQKAEFSDNILVLSEYPADYHMSKRTLYERNRIISAISNSMIIVSSKDKKLYPIIDQFLNLGKEIFCFSPDAEDTQNENINLINNGAILITNLDKPINDNFLM
ncbi:DNA-processing protein DprA [Metamycoplasma hyosynoviae]|uniref:DNA-processing protein DprA n=1 Tax=Metamycoplasma hyosynoviae TaxID=29559 RepID=UPI0023589ADC|nr:DNA-processing protein DprA [Metamycoplasma hyosynoviae]MDC8921609.1 DNA-processing protein DprA [Metamycoplasma hyosynoviae]